HSAADQHLCQPTGNALQGGLANSVVDHLRRNIQRRLAGNELDATPASGLHALGVMARQTHTTEYVDLKDLLPVLVINREERLGAMDTEGIDQKIRVRLSCNQLLAALGSPCIGDDSKGGIASAGGLQACQSRVDSALLAPHQYQA